MYIVKYSAGSYDDWHEVDIFVTKSKETADKYVEKFNTLLEKFKIHNQKFEEGEEGWEWIKPEYSEKFFDRWYKIKEVNECYYHEIKVNER